MNTPRFTFLTGMALAAAAMRLLPHPPNFTPVAALALFGGAQFTSKRAAFLVPLAAMFLSDLVIGLHANIPVVYGCFTLINCLGLCLRRQTNPAWIACAALVGSVLFFVLTNFGVWILGDLYPKTVAGLGECYAAAIPFFRNTLLGDLFYVSLLFGGLSLAEKSWPVLAETSSSAIRA